jgi:Complex1_LYR-like
MSGASRKASTLYRTLLRAHKRHLPPDMQSLGNSYLQSEFRAHRKATAAQAEAFFQAWNDYHLHLMTTVQEREKQERNAAILAVQGIAAEQDAALATVSNTSSTYRKNKSNSFKSYETRQSSRLAVEGNNE